MPLYKTLLKIGLILLFLLCLLPMPYGFYQLVRFTGMFGFGILAVDSFGKNQVFFVIFLASAVLINPFIKIPLGREIWNIVDVIWAVILAISIFIPSPGKGTGE